MKSIFTSIFILFSIISFSQEVSVYNCYKSVRGTWNSYLGKWQYDDPKVSNLKFKIYKNVITVNDEANSRYETFGEGEKINKQDYNEVSWDALDEKNRKITFSVVGYTDGRMVFMVFYDGVVFVYFVNQSGLSPLQ